MERHLLVTVSENIGALYGVRFVGGFFTDKAPLRITLFYGIPRPVGGGAGERSGEDLAGQHQQRLNYENKGRQALEAAAKELVALGFKREQIDMKLLTRQFSKVRDIVHEAEKSLYDAVVLGRRGISFLEKAFDESVTEGLLDLEVTFPLWICRKPESGRKDVLVCVDGGDPSFRIVDHVGFTLAGQTDHKVRLLTLRKPGSVPMDPPETLFGRYREILVKNGFPEERIETKVLEAGNISKAILKEAEAGRVAVVAAGRTGVGKGLMGSLFMGSISSALCRELEGAVFWCSR